jgi:hypothetical protein
MLKNIREDEARSSGKERKKEAKHQISSTKTQTSTKHQYLKQEPFEFGI